MKPRWTYEEILKRFNQILPPLDPDNPKQRKRLKILGAASDHFVRHGYRKANVAEIARSAGVAKGTVYLYFKTKADLLVHAIAEEKRRYINELAPILAEEVEPRERLRRWLRGILVITNQMPLTSRLLQGDREVFLVLKEMNAEVRDDSLEIHYGFLSEMLELAARPHRWTPSELEDRTKVLIGLIYAAGAFFREEARGGLSLERFAEILASFLVDGVSCATLLPPAPPSGGGQQGLP